MLSRTRGTPWVVLALLSAAAPSSATTIGGSDTTLCRLDPKTRVCTLERDVEVTGPLALAADRLTLDCDGHTLRGAGGTGRLEIVRHAHVTVRDCVLDGVAIRVVASRDVTIARNQLAGAFDAVAAFSTSLLRVTDNELTGGGGITLSLVDKALVRDNRIAGAFTGVAAFGVTRALVAGNTISDAAGVAIGLAYARDNTLRGNLVERCGSRGLELVHASENLIADNRVTGCGAGVYGRRSPAGVAVSGGRRNLLTRNTIEGNHVGVLFGGDGNRWAGNVVAASALDDLVFDAELGCANELAADNRVGGGALLITRDHQVVRGGRFADVLVCGARGVLLSGVTTDALRVHRAPLVMVHESAAGHVVLSGSDFGLFVGNQLGRRGDRPSAVEAGGSAFVTFARNGADTVITDCRLCIIAQNEVRAAAGQLATRAR